jgi:DNA polymerase III subunit delta
MAVYLVSCSDEFLLNRRAKELMKNSASLSLSAGEVSISQLAESLSPSLFGDALPVFFQDLQEIDLDDVDQLLKLIAELDEQQILVIGHSAGQKGKGAVDKIKKAGAQFIALDPIKNQSERIAFLQAEFKTLKRKITPEAIMALASAIGSDLASLASAASQLASDLIPGAVIEVVDIEKYYGGQAELSGFDVADAVINRDRNLALIKVRSAIINGVEPIAISSALAANVRAMAKVSGLSRSAKSFEVASQLQMPPWQIDKARRALANWTPESFRDLVIRLGQLDLELKGASADPLYSLESAILALTK